MRCPILLFLPLAVLLALSGCDSDPRDAPPPSVEDLIEAYSDQPPGEGVVHEGAHVSTSDLINASVSYYSSGVSIYRFWIEFEGKKLIFSISPFARERGY